MSADPHDGVGPPVNGRSARWWSCAQSPPPPPQDDPPPHDELLQELLLHDEPPHDELLQPEWWLPSLLQLEEQLLPTYPAPAALPRRIRRLPPEREPRVTETIAPITARTATKMNSPVPLIAVLPLLSLPVGRAPGARRFHRSRPRGRVGR